MFGSTARLSLALAFAALTLTAANICNAQDWQQGAGDNWKRVLEAARKEGKVIVAGDVAPLAEVMPAAFKRDTGVDMELVVGRQGEIQTRIDREAQTHNPTIDVVFGGGVNIRLAYEGLLEPIKPQLVLPSVTDPKYWIGGKIHWYDKKTTQYMFQGSNWVHGWPLLNPKLVDSKAISSWKDLLKPQFKGKIAAADPRGGGPGRAQAAYIVETFGADFFKQLYVGQEVAFTRDNRQLVEWIARGSYLVALGSLPPFIEMFKSQGLDLEVPILPDGPGSLLGGYSVTSQLKGVPHPNAAAVFNNWYASRAGQEIFAKAMLETSTRTDVKVQIPDYIVPKPGYKYLDQYDEDWNNETRPKDEKVILEVLGGR